MDQEHVRRELAARAESVRARLQAEHGTVPHRERVIEDPGRDPPESPDDMFPWAAVCLVEDGAGNVLYLTVEGQGHDHLDLEPPGGKGESGERPAETARREVREETGVECRVTDLLLVETLWFDYGDPYPVAQGVFAGETTGGEAGAREDAIDEVRWVDATDPPDTVQFRDLLDDL